MLGRMRKWVRPTAPVVHHLRLRGVIQDGRAGTLSLRNLEKALEKAFGVQKPNRGRRAGFIAGLFKETAVALVSRCHCCHGSDRAFCNFALLSSLRPQIFMGGGNRGVFKRTL